MPRALSSDRPHALLPNALSRTHARLRVCLLLAFIVAVLLVLVGTIGNDEIATYTSQSVALPRISDRWRVWPPDLRRAICRPQIYIYPIPPELQLDEEKIANCRWSAYQSELLLHKSLKDQSTDANRLYLVDDPGKADLFLIPLFGSCYLHNCWIANGWKQEERCDVDEKYVLPMLQHVMAQSYWQRFNGTDHVLIHPMDHGDQYYQPLSQSIMRQAIYMTTVGDKRTAIKGPDEYRRYRNIVIPSATNLLHAYKIDPMAYLDEDGFPKTVSRGKRTIQVLFRGGGRNTMPSDYYSEGVRSLFFNELRREGESVGVAPLGSAQTAGWGKISGWDIATESEQEDYASRLSLSRYGLAPSGWTLDTTRIWEYIAFGVVPIIIADGVIEPFEDDVDWSDGNFVLRVRRRDAHRLPEILRAIPEWKYREMSRRVWKVARRMVLDDSGFVWHYIARDLCRISGLQSRQVFELRDYEYIE